MSKVISIVGKSGSGKTTLIEKLIGSLKKEGPVVAVVKHAGGGFDIDRDRKDSKRFSDAGADYVNLLSDDKSVAFQNSEPDVEKSVFQLYASCDFIILEGFREITSFRRILVVDEKGDIPHPMPKDISAVYSYKNFEMEIDVPLFSENDIAEVISWMKDIEPNRFALRVNGKSVPAKQFVEDIISNVVIAAAQSLRLPDEEIDTLEIVLKKAE
jgi:molybdopterin-guanine dinucleotide biosynthesis protein B